MSTLTQTTHDRLVMLSSVLRAFSCWVNLRSAVSSESTDSMSLIPSRRSFSWCSFKLPSCFSALSRTFSNSYPPSAEMYHQGSTLTSVARRRRCSSCSPSMSVS